MIMGSCSWRAIIIMAGAHLLVMTTSMSGGADGYNFYSDFDIVWGGEDGHVKILENGQLLTMSLDKLSGGALKSKREFLFCRIHMKMKLIPRNSAGTVTTLYMSSPRPEHDEIDFEFLGNLTGDPYTIHTNVYAMGKGDKEMQFKPWFDPTNDFHTYTILWNPLNIIFYVDDTPIRVFKNEEDMGVPFPKSKPMKLKSSLWNADDWATQGGRIKTNWTQAPFVASYRGYDENACTWDGWGSHCWDTSWMYKTLDATEMYTLQWLQDNYMIYNYCTDYKRFPQGLPKECTMW